VSFSSLKLYGKSYHFVADVGLSVCKKRECDANNRIACRFSGGKAIAALNIIWEAS
jgi:hypothetical protein